MSEIVLRLSGLEFGGWKSAGVTRSMESLSSSFSLQLTDRWKIGGMSYPIREEDPCTVSVGGNQVLQGFVARRSVSISVGQRTLDVSGMSTTAELVECSAIFESAPTLRSATVADVARVVCEPYGIPVRVQDGLEIPAPSSKLSINPGDTAFSVIERAAADAGVLAISDTRGCLLLTRSGIGRSEAVVEGINLLGGAVDYRSDERYRRYIVSAQLAGTDRLSGNETRVRAEASDVGVRRFARTLVIRPESGRDRAAAKRRADWEARVRAARSETVRAIVNGWTQSDGEIWDINKIVSVESPSLGVSGDMLVSQVTYSIGSRGELTEMSLVRPDAYLPDPGGRVGPIGEQWRNDGEVAVFPRRSDGLG